MKLAARVAGLREIDVKTMKGRREAQKLARVHGPIVVREKNTELSHRSTSYGWTPWRTVAAGANADAGNMDTLADLCQAIMTDDRVNGVLQTRTHTLPGLGVSFGGGSKAAIEALKGADDEPGEWWQMASEAELAELEAWGIVMGVGLAQIVELPRVIGQQHRYRLEVWSPRWLRYDAQAHGGTHWSVQTEQGEERIYPGDGQWIIYTPYGAKKPWTKGAWNKLAFPWLLKRFSLEDRANHSQVLGQPLWVGHADKGGTEPQRTKFLNQLRTLGKAGKLVLPAGWDLDLKEASGESWQIYTEQVSEANEAITITLAGQLVTTEGAKGFSNGDNQQAILTDLIRFDAETLSTCLREQLLAPWARVNFDSANDAPWPKWAVPEKDDRKQEAETQSAVGDAIDKLDKALSPHGVRVNVAELAAQYRIPLEKVSAQQVSTSIPLAPTDVAKTCKVNEARSANGLGPLMLGDGTTPDPRGNMLISDLMLAGTAPAGGAPGTPAAPQNKPGATP